MTDKERILSVVIHNIIPGLLYDFGKEKKDYIENCLLSSSNKKTTVAEIGKILEKEDKKKRGSRC